MTFNDNTKPINWNEAKNQWLKINRDVSFEDVLVCLNEGLVLDNLKHPNQQKYQGQRILVVLIRQYVYLVPYVESETEYFLKTIIPSRKATTKKYLKLKE